MGIKFWQDLNLPVRRMRYVRCKCVNKKFFGQNLIWRFTSRLPNCQIFPLHGTQLNTLILEYFLSDDPMIELHTYGGLSSLFSRAYHTRPTQHAATDLEQNASSAHLLPAHHPLLDRTVENSQQQQQASRTATGSTGIQVGNVPPSGSDSHHQESAMQQLLTNISAATGTNEVLGFGVGSSGNRMTRPTPSLSQPATVDDNLESTNIPTALSRWEEESLALDGHVPHLIVRAMRNEVCNTLTEMYEKENATPAESSKPPEISAASTSQSTLEDQGSSSVPVTAVATTTGSQQGGETSRNLPIAPHPSDQVTPSSRSPRGASSTVDQLRSSLRQVADALAQTVAAVRSTREQLLEVQGSMTEEEEDEATEEVQQPQLEVGDADGCQSSLVHGHTESELPTAMESTDSVPETLSLSSAAEASQSLSSQQLTSDSPTSVPATVPAQDTTASSTGSAVHPTFDGSQESAAATLASTDPHDPLYTFLSAVAGAPAPPLTDAPSTSSQPHTSQMQTPPTVTSPRLPVFTQFQQLSSTATTSVPTSSISQSHSDSIVSHSETQVSQQQTAIPVSVIQDSRSLTTSALAEQQAASVAGSESSIAADQQSQEDRERDEMISDACAEVTRDMYDLASQVTSFFSRHPQYQNDSTTEATHSLLGAANMADNLAQELARAVTQMTPTATSPQDPTTTTSSSVMPSTLSAQSQQQRQSLQSPSPSDTLAPLLLSSLQMASGNGAESASVTGEPGPIVRGDQQALGVSGGSRPDYESGTDLQPPRLDLAEAGGIAQMELSSDTHTPTTNQDNLLASIIHDHHTLQSNSPETRETSQSSSASLTSATGTSTATLSSTMLTPTTGEVTQNTSEASATQLPSDQQQSQSQAQARAQAQASIIDPTFLAALPETIRREVVAQHEREQFTSSISPEFLAALPPNIQEEVSEMVMMHVCVCMCICVHMCN